jgi:FAD/FMN-containing dehydrogenase
MMIYSIKTSQIFFGSVFEQVGARWSYNNQPYTNEYMVAMQGLTYAKVGIENEEYLEAPYKDKKELLVHVQGGVKIKYLYKTLFRHGTTLSTSGTTDGQTIAGAVNTGTHNAALQFGSMADSIRGIHLVIPDVTTNNNNSSSSSKSVFLQKQSDPVVTQEYATFIVGADELRSDDDLFNAALVSFGTFGIVHAYLIEVEPLFKLQVQVKSFPFSEAMDWLYKLDLKSLGFNLNDSTGELQWHVEAIINPMQSGTFFFVILFSILENLLWHGSIYFLVNLIVNVLSR